MRVRIHLNEVPLSGYDNIRVGSTEELTAVVNKFDSGELDELILEAAFDLVPLNIAEETLGKLTKLVKKNGGKFIIIGRDLYEVCKAFTNYNIDISDVNTLLFGENKRIGFPAITMSDLLKNNLGLKIIKKRVDEFVYSIEAQR
jgi:hypothetical protein